MWLFSPCFGFLSAVQHRDQKDNLIVRFRSRDQADLFSDKFGTPEAVHTPKADYGFRIILDKKRFGEIIKDLVNDLEYDNFKDEAHLRLDEPAFDLVLHQVWETLYKFQASRLRSMPE